MTKIPLLTQYQFMYQEALKSVANLCFRDAKNYASLCDCQSTDFIKLHYHFNASFTAINLAKAACKSIGRPCSITTCKSVIHNAYMLERFICVSGIEPNTWGY